jgi:hypothetical protein
VDVNSVISGGEGEATERCGAEEEVGWYRGGGFGSEERLPAGRHGVPEMFHEPCILPRDYGRVDRLETDEGERIVGRLISSEGLSRICRNVGLDQTEVITAAEVWESLLEGSAVVALAGNMTLRRVRVMNDYRVEFAGFSDGMRDRLRSIGHFSEMIAWKVRFFIPASDGGQAVLSRLIERHRIVDVTGRS